jgi:hypothetical protein
MGSYEGSSDWDDLPARASFATFKPRPAAQAEEPAPPGGNQDDDIALDARPARPRLNAIFAFDTTGSMTKWVKNTQDKMNYLTVGLQKLLDMEIEIIGVGDHADGRNMLQIHPFTSDQEALDANVKALQPTDGRDTPEAFECLFKVLNTVEYPVPTVLVIITDSIPHDMEDYEGQDDGCPFAVDYLTELEDLQEKLKKVYLVSCTTDPHILDLQRQLVGANALIELTDLLRLVNLIMAICMDEVGELDMFMNILEKQRGPDRRREILGLLGRSV